MDSVAFLAETFVVIATMLPGVSDVEIVDTAAQSCAAVVFYPNMGTLSSIVLRFGLDYPI